MIYVSNENPVKSRTTWADLDAISQEINSLGLTYDYSGKRWFVGELFEIWISRPSRYGYPEIVHVYPLVDNVKVPRGCRLWIYFMSDHEVSYAVLNPWDDMTSLGQKMDLVSYDPMTIWTTVVHSQVHCRCKKPVKFQQDYDE